MGLASSAAPHSQGLVDGKPVSFTYQRAGDAGERELKFADEEDRMLSTRSKR